MPTPDSMDKVMNFCRLMIRLSSPCQCCKSHLSIGRKSILHDGSSANVQKGRGTTSPVQGICFFNFHYTSPCQSLVCHCCWTAVVVDACGCTAQVRFRYSSKIRITRHSLCSITTSESAVRSVSASTSSCRRQVVPPSTTRRCSSTSSIHTVQYV